MDDESEHTSAFISKLNVNTDERLVFVNESGQCRRHCRADRYSSRKRGAIVLEDN